MKNVIKYKIERNFYAKNCSGNVMILRVSGHKCMPLNAQERHALPRAFHDEDKRSAITEPTRAPACPFATADNQNHDKRDVMMG